MPKPSTLPKFAVTDIVDPTSGQLNVVEPDASHKDYGWGFKEKPPRQFYNWLHRWTYAWLKWIDDTNFAGILDLQLYSNEQSFTTATGGTLSGGKILFTAQWCRVGNMVFLTPISTSFTRIKGALAAPCANALRFGLQSGGVWPDAFIMTPFSTVPIMAIADDKIIPSILSIFPVAHGSSGDWLIERPMQPSTQGNINDLYSGQFANISGIFTSTLCFMVDAI